MLNDSPPSVSSGQPWGTTTSPHYHVHSVIHSRPFNLVIMETERWTAWSARLGLDETSQILGDKPPSSRCFSTDSLSILPRLSAFEYLG